jgi:hypothetical protein
MDVGQNPSSYRHLKRLFKSLSIDCLDESFREVIYSGF